MLLELYFGCKYLLRLTLCEVYGPSHIEGKLDAENCGRLSFSKAER